MMKRMTDSAKRNHRLFKGRKGFTLVELLAVISILAAITVASVPAVSGAIVKSRETVCETNRNTIERTFFAYRIDHRDATLQDVLDGKLSDFPLDLSEIRCPSGGIYTVEGNHIVCSDHHGEDE